MLRRRSAATHVLIATLGLTVPLADAAGGAPIRNDGTVSAPQLLDLAERAARSGDLHTAEAAYRALFADPSVAVRSEARYRLSIILVGENRQAEAAILLRTILDEQPGAQPVRLQLAHVLDLIGDEAGARRALREAQAGGLPPDVARMVDRYSAALRAQKPLGASIDIALAPDSNINRATRSSTLGTVIGDFTLDENAKQRSGLGLSLRGQGYARLRLSGRVNLLGRLSGSADLYRDNRFNDVVLAATLGPEIRLGSDRFSFEAGEVWRWYGGMAYSRGATVNLNYFHSLSRRTQLRGEARFLQIGNRLSPSQSGHSWSASLSLERALSSRGGVGVTFSADRQALADPGYSTWSGRVSLLGYRELGPVTLVATTGLGRLKADERLMLFPQKRSDHSQRFSHGATYRGLHLGSLAPFARATFERNRSTIEIQDYRKLRVELGITRSF